MSQQVWAKVYESVRAALIISGLKEYLDRVYEMASNIGAAKDNERRFILHYRNQRSVSMHLEQCPCPSYHMVLPLWVLVGID